MKKLEIYNSRDYLVLGFMLKPLVVLGSTTLEVMFFLWQGDTIGFMFLIFVIYNMSYNGVISSFLYNNYYNIFYTLNLTFAVLEIKFS